MSRRRSRYQAAMERRAKAKRDSDRALRTVTQAATAGALMVFAVVIVAILEGPSGFARAADILAQPVLGPLSLGAVLLVMGLAWLGAALLLRLRR